MDPKEAGACRTCGSTLASFLCACTSPSTYYCEVCLPDHLRKVDLVHIPSSTFLTTDRGMSGISASEICTECQTREAMYLCICSSTSASYCEACFHFHFSKGLEALHYKLPVAATGLFTAGTPLDQLLKRQLYIDYLNRKLKNNLPELDAFIEFAQHEFESVIAKMIEEKQKFLTEIRLFRVQVIQQISDIEKAIDRLRYETLFSPETALDWLILNGWTQVYDYSPQVLRLFESAVDMTPLLVEMSRCARVKSNKDGFPGEFPVLSIPVLKSNKMLLYSLPEMHLKEVAFPTTAIDGSSAYCFIDSNSLLTCGGVTHNKVYLLNIELGTITPMAPMNFTRSWPSIYKHQDFVYVFGGWVESEKLASAEKFDLKTNVWAVLSNTMKQARHGATPAFHQYELYIVGGFHMKSIEVFNIDQEQFRELALTLPNTYSCVSFVHQGELIVVQNDSLLSWKINSTQTNFRKAGIPSVGDCWSNVSPILRDGDAYFVFNNGSAPSGVMMCNLTGGYVAKVRSFS